MWFRALALACLALAGCDSEPGESGGDAGLEAGAPLGVQPYLYTAEGAGYTLLEAGGALELWAAPQGGHWARIGARVSGLDTDTAKLVARLIDPVTGELVVEATRTTPMVPTADDPSLKQPEPTDMYHVVHLPLCPGEDGRALEGMSFRLELEVTELYGDFSTGTSSLPVVPTCQQPPGAEKDFCSCECGPGYSLGKCAVPSKG